MNIGALRPIHLPVELLNAWLYLLLALLVAVEGPIATLAGAIAASGGLLDARWVFVAAALGNFSADLLWYSLGYMGKTEWLVHYGKWLGVKPNVIGELKQQINEHVGKLLFVAKLTLGLVVPTLVAAGLAHVPTRRWIPVLFTAETIWTGGLVLIGYYYGQYVLHIEKGLKWISIGSALMVVILIGLYILRSRSSSTNS